MKRAIVLAFSAAALACMPMPPVVAQPGAAGAAAYGVGRDSDYTNPRKESPIDVGFQARMKGASRPWMSDSLCGLVLQIHAAAAEMPKLDERLAVESASPGLRREPDFHQLRRINRHPL
jgi:hypothetical protein